MMTLFVDVDDTLILWLDEGGQHDPFGIVGDAWKPNTRLILEIERWVDTHPNDRVVVWSGGGEDYARMWGQRVLHHIPHKAIEKAGPTLYLPFSTDLCIDDMMIEVRSPVANPLTWKHNDGISMLPGGMAWSPPIT